MTLVSSIPLFFPPTFLLKPTNQPTGKVLVAKKDMGFGNVGEKRSYT